MAREIWVILLILFFQQALAFKWECVNQGGCARNSVTGSDPLETRSYTGWRSEGVPPNLRGACENLLGPAPLTWSYCVSACQKLPSLGEM